MAGAARKTGVLLLLLVIGGCVGGVTGADIASSRSDPTNDQFAAWDVPIGIFEGAVVGCTVAIMVWVAWLVWRSVTRNTKRS
jgi:hypothetical protein